MDYKNALIKEFENRVFSESYERIYRCLSMISDKDLWNSPNPKIPAIGNLVIHLCGNARQWILSGIGNYPDNRDRDQEFIVHSNIKKSDLVFLLENLKTNIRIVLEEMPDIELDHYRRIQSFDVTGFSAIVHVLEHFSYHTGQITTLTKWITNRNTDYYSGFDLNELNRLN